MALGAVAGWFARGSLPAPGTYGPVPLQLPTAGPAVKSPAAGHARATGPRAAGPRPSPAAIAASPVSVVTRAPEAAPEIVSMSLSSPVVSGGDVVTGVVLTSSNVASVEARIAGYSTSLSKVGVGRFALSYRVPELPIFLHRTYQIQVTARNTRGDAVTSSLPVTVR